MIAEIVIDRFWSKVDKSGDCWTWTAALVGGGYGGIKINGVMHYAHRVSWRIHIGEIPVGLNILHSCDNPPCVRPEHLFIGTQRDNVIDMINKGRNNPLRGTSHANARLTDNDVLAIRAKYRQGNITQRQLATEFKIGQSTASEILLRQTWNHI